MNKREAFVITGDFDWSSEFSDWHFTAVDGREIYIEDAPEDYFQINNIVILEPTDKPVNGQEHVEVDLGTYWKLAEHGSKP